MDVAPCYKGMGWGCGSPGGVRYRASSGAKNPILDGCSTVLLLVDRWDWISPGGVRYGAPYGAKKASH